MAIQVCEVGFGTTYSCGSFATSLQVEFAAARGSVAAILGTAFTTLIGAAAIAGAGRLRAGHPVAEA